ncbi:hypothetical protein D9M72_518690 [compost metagenome]
MIPILGGSGKGISAGNLFGFTLLDLVLYGVGAMCNQLLSFVGLFARQGAGQVGVAAQAMPAPFAVRFFVAKLP